MLSDGDPAAIGRATILPASHAGSDRYMQQRGQDALWYCQLCGNPDLFMTVTANAKWPEIQRELRPGQTATGHYCKSIPPQSEKDQKFAERAQARPSVYKILVG